MTRISRRRTLGLCLGGLAASGSLSRILASNETATPAKSDGWTSFRNGPEQQGIAHTDLAQNPKMKWEVSSPDGWIATCAIAGGHVYAPALRGYLHCLSKEDGKELWRYRSIDSKDEEEFAPGFKAAPLVTDDTVYIGDEDGILHSIDRKTGELKWKYATDAEIAGGVAVWEDKILLASHDAFLYCLEKDGTEAWKFETNDRINCSPAIVNGFTFVSGCDQQLRVIDLKNGIETRNVEMNSQLIASPAVFDDLLYVGSYGGDVTALNWTTGEIAWRYRGKRDLPYYASAAVTEKLVLVGGHDKIMHAIDRETGRAAWTFSTNARIESSPAVVDERVFFGSGDKNIYGLSIADGSEVWKFNAGKAVNAGIAIGEGCLVVGEDDTNGKLRCFA